MGKVHPLLEQRGGLKKGGHRPPGKQEGRRGQGRKKPNWGAGRETKGKCKVKKGPKGTARETEGAVKGAGNEPNNAQLLEKRERQKKGRQKERRIKDRQTGG